MQERLPEVLFREAVQGGGQVHDAKLMPSLVENVQNAFSTFARNNLLVERIVPRLRRGRRDVSPSAPESRRPHWR